MKIPGAAHSWICDSCGERIGDVEDGWVEWLKRRESDELKARGLRVVHRRPASPRGANAGCQYDQDAEFSRDESTVSDSALQFFLGTDGLIQLLSFIDEGSLPKDEVLEMIKRLHVPGYEQARFHFVAAISDGAFEPNTREGYYRRADIQATIKWADANR